MMILLNSGRNKVWVVAVVTGKVIRKTGGREVICKEALM